MRGHRRGTNSNLAHEIEPAQLGHEGWLSAATGGVAPDPRSHLAQLTSRVAIQAPDSEVEKNRSNSSPAS